MKAKPLVTIKGMKDGLVFLLDDQCEFTDLLQELRDKLDHTPHFFDGPLVYVDVKLGARTAADEQKTEMLNILRQRGNLIIRSLESDPDVKKEAQGYRVHTMTGMVRSGQVLRHDGHLFFLGDINPGGMIISSGDIIVFGALRGTAHAGADGETDAVIAASLFAPTQLRIADVISRPPDEWGLSQAHMEFAYIHDGMMQIDKISQLYRVRKDITLFKGV